MIKIKDLLLPKHKKHKPKMPIEMVLRLRKKVIITDKKKAINKNKCRIRKMDE